MVLAAVVLAILAVSPLAAQEDWTRRAFDTHGLSVEIPPGWVVDDTDEEGVLIASNPEFLDDEDVDSAVVAILHMPLAGSPFAGMSIQEIWGMMAQTFEGQDYSFGEPEFITVHDQEAMRITATLPMDERTVAGDFYVLLPGEDAFVVFAAAMPDTLLEQYRPAMERVVYSMRFEPPAPSPGEPRPVDLDLLAAAKNGDPGALERAMKDDADVDVRDDLNRTPLSYAAERGPLENLHTLIVSGADLDATDYQGRTALMFATREGNTQKVQALLEAGADLFVEDEYGTTAGDLAEDFGYDDIAELLSKAAREQQR